MSAEPPQEPKEESFSARDPLDASGIVSGDQPIQDYRQRYGLSMDPFSEEPYYPFFAGGQRGELLEQVIHLCQFGQGVTVVVGAPGVGKTRFALALYESLDQSQVCFISALPTLQADVLLQHIAAHAGFETAGATTGQLISALTDPDNFSQEHGFSLIVIDDAHHLDDETIAALLRITRSADTAHQKFQAVLIGDALLVDRLKNLPVIPTQINEYVLPALTLSETVDYLAFRMEMADYLGPDIFSESLISPWWRSAQGRLSIVHSQAREHLLSTTRPQAKTTTTKNFPVVHIVAAAALGCAILMALFYRGGDASSDIPKTQRIPLNLQAVSSASLSSMASASVTQSVIAPAVSEESDLRVSEASAVVLSEAHHVTSSLSVAVSSASSVAVSSAVSRVAAHSSAPASVSQPTSLSADEQVLMSWGEGEYTLQLLGVSNRKAATDFVASQTNRDALLLFRSTRQGKDWFVVVVGRYQNTAQARAAVAGLPELQSKGGPWPRALKDIQQELRQRH